MERARHSQGFQGLPGRHFVVVMMLRRGTYTRRLDWRCVQDNAFSEQPVVR